MILNQPLSFGKCSVPIHCLPSLAAPLRPGVVAPDRVLSMCQIEQFDIQSKVVGDGG